MKSENVKFFLTIGLVGVAGYFIYQAIKGIPKVGNALLNAPAAIGNDIGSTLYEWINPYPAGYDTYYTVIFGDGSRHAIHSTDVAANGAFTYSGQNYILKTDSAGQRYAVNG